VRDISFENLRINGSLILSAAAGNISVDSYAYNVTFSNDSPSNLTAHGVPYSWFDSHGITNNYATAENLDIDNDGMINWKEYYAGTDPTNAASFSEYAA